MRKNIDEIESKFYIGATASIHKKVSLEEVKKFAELTGDYNGVHLNEEISKKSIFGSRVCHGMLIASYISTVLGMYLPGEGTIYLSQDLQFKHPVYLDEEITVTVEIVEIIEGKDIIILDTKVIKEDGSFAITGSAKIMYKQIK